MFHFRYFYGTYMLNLNSFSITNPIFDLKVSLDRAYQDSKTLYLRYPPRGYYIGTILADFIYRWPYIGMINFNKYLVIFIRLFHAFLYFILYNIIGIYLPSFITNIFWSLNSHEKARMQLKIVIKMRKFKLWLFTNWKIFIFIERQSKAFIRKHFILCE